MDYRPPRTRAQRWTVHDGQFFAQHVLRGTGRAPAERELLTLARSRRSGPRQTPASQGHGATSLRSIWLLEGSYPHPPPHGDPRREQSLHAGNMYSAVKAREAQAHAASSSMDWLRAVSPTPASTSWPERTLASVSAELRAAGRRDLGAGEQSASSGGGNLGSLDSGGQTSGERPTMGERPKVPPCRSVWLAAQAGDEVEVKRWLEAGGDANAMLKVNEGQAPHGLLTIAITSGSRRLVEVLLDHSVDLNSTTYKGEQLCGHLAGRGGA